MRLFVFLLCFFFLFKADGSQAKRIAAFTVIGDYQSACREGKEAFRANPFDKVIWSQYLKALAAAGKEKEMLALYKHEKNFSLSNEESREALEIISWGILDRAAKSQSPLIRVLSMVAASLTGDARGVTILDEQLGDKNALIRLTAVQLSGDLRDQRIKDKVLLTAKNEKHFDTRLGAIQAIGKMKIKQGKPLLNHILNHPRSSLEERVVATEAVVNLTDDATRADIAALITSDRAGMRQLACLIAAYFQVEQVDDLIAGLVTDTHADVRTSAVVTLGLGENPSEKTKLIIEKTFQDPDVDVKIAAAWALTRHAPQRGQDLFRILLSTGPKEQKRKAAAALAACGSLGLPLLKESFLAAKDPYLSVNLALGLIGQRVLVKESLEVLAKNVVGNDDRWMFLETKHYKAVMPSKIAHNPAIPQYPEAVNQTTRLELINILAMLDYPHIQEVMKGYLQKRPWGITGMATALMLTEGDETAIEAVSKLLDDRSSRVRIQAALVLALWGRSPKAIQTLEKSYDTTNRDEKEKILEGLGRIGDASSIPFLADKLNEHNQSLRIIAATALLQCLYH